MAFRPLIWIFLILIIVTPLQASDIKLNPNHPSSYKVVKGDTLWDISGRFLQQPWRWQEVWKKNPQIKNPDLIYPGDLITLTYVDGQPVLQVQRNGAGSIAGQGSRSFSGNDNKLRPEIRSSAVSEAITVIPVETVRPFITKPEVVSATKLDESPYIVALSDKRVIAGAGDKIYVRSIEAGDHNSYLIYHKGEVYTDPESKEILGYEAKYIANTELVRYGDPATLKIIKARQEVAEGDRLLPVSSASIQFNYFPHAPQKLIEGHIISVMDGVSLIGQYSVIVLDRGIKDGVEVGHVMEINQFGGSVLDKVSAPRDDKVKLPDERAGILMVFRTFERVSYALVMSAHKTIHVTDTVRTPDF